MFYGNKNVSEIGINTKKIKSRPLLRGKTLLCKNMKKTEVLYGRHGCIVTARETLSLRLPTDSSTHPVSDKHVLFTRRHYCADFESQELMHL